MDDLGLVGVEGGKRVGVPRGDGGIDAGDVRGRGVRLQPPTPPGCASCRAGGRRRRSRGEYVESRERLVVAIGVEELDARQKTIGPGHPEPEEMPLVGAATGPVGAEVRPAYEERVVSQGEDIVDAVG